LSEFLDVAELLFRREGHPMSARQLVDMGFAEGLFSDRISGRTPEQTMKSKLSVEIRKNGSSSRFVRTRPGMFFLRDVADPSRVYVGQARRAPLPHEWVMTFPAKDLHVVGAFQGLRCDWRRYVKQLLSSGRCRAMPRMEAEGTTDFKQVLTYILVTRGPQVLAFKRGSYNRLEAMLRGAECIGFGGHVSSEDRTIFSDDDIGLWDSAARELAEEVRLPAEDRARLASRDGLSIIGVINDDSSNLGERHFAVVFRYEVSESPDWDTPQRGEDSITRLRWIDLGSEVVRLSDFEYWSQLCFRAYFLDAVRSSADFHLRRRSPLRPPGTVAVCGQLGSGKSAAADVLKRRFGYEVVNSGHVLAELLGCPPVPDTPRDEFQAAAWAFISGRAGPKQLARALDRAVHARGERVVIDGIRQAATLEHLRSARERRRVGVIYVETAPDLAWEFYRSREGLDLSARKFYELRAAPVEADVAKLIGQAEL
jgi:predicted NUDIX family phosphoesterase/predicted kinase